MVIIDHGVHLDGTGTKVVSITIMVVVDHAYLIDPILPMVTYRKIVADRNIKGDSFVISLSSRVFDGVHNPSNSSQNSDGARNSYVFHTV